MLLSLFLGFSHLSNAFLLDFIYFGDTEKLISGCWIVHMTLSEFKKGFIHVSGRGKENVM